MAVGLVDAAGALRGSIGEMNVPLPLQIRAVGLPLPVEELYHG